MEENKKQLKAHDFPEVYTALGIDLAKLGCVMLDVEPLLDMVPDKEDADALYVSKNEARFWIDGWCADKTAHVTLLYGLMYPAKQYKFHIDKVLDGWKLDSVTIKDIGFFESPYADEPYYCLVAHIETSEKLLEGNARLEFLPHINTFEGYKPHMTIAYIKKDEKVRDAMIKRFSEAWVGKELEVVGINLGGDKK